MKYLIFIFVLFVTSCTSQVDNIDQIASDPIYLEYKKLVFKSAEMVIQGTYDFELINDYWEDQSNADPCVYLDEPIPIPGASMYFEINCSITKKIDQLHEIYDYRNFSEEKLHAIGRKFDSLIGDQLKKESIAKFAPENN